MAEHPGQHIIEDAAQHQTGIADDGSADRATAVSGLYGERVGRKKGFLCEKFRRLFNNFPMNSLPSYQARYEHGLRTILQIYKLANVVVTIGSSNILRCTVTVQFPGLLETSQERKTLNFVGFH
ncbi:uncharacterized protein BCR38DRAFT_410964 [Pseudomassariella vexata]|uniref:Uncharacterized protein n=1 Tax=Pseudomassariella vexata TaxID=1141098 RepID=A0A1Y2DV92_9PEZI|nr:uncharacterized protein BCR38DRAFT_410964 [Pseudomassariella vexata]ORY62565.1 hypothetical protein BCR38DRAFT_410964 [Pseudomassariella vexata]